MFTPLSQQIQHEVMMNVLNDVKATCQLLSMSRSALYEAVKQGRICALNMVVRGSVRVNIGAKNVVASVWVKSIGGQVQVDPFGGNLGAYVSEASWDPAIGVGSGAPQAVLGTIPIGFGILQSLNGGDALPTDQLGAAGTYADTLVYTLNF